MDYEKKYKEALERARQFSEKPYLEDSKGIVDYIFPELKESEADRKRRIICSLTYKIGQHLRDIFTEEEYQCFDAWSNAWLEKQVEHKPAVIIPKFRVGDEIKTSNEESLTITKIDEKGYWSEDLFICGFDDTDNWKLVEQKPAEWSEEDEEIHRKCICAMRASACGFPEEEKFVEQVDNWLKSLKDRYAFKPSKEQIKVCKKVYADILSAKGFDLGTVNGELNRLEEELKKLREE